MQKTLPLLYRDRLRAKIAFHESGHVILALHEGLVIHHASIEPVSEVSLDLEPEPYEHDALWRMVYSHARFYIAGWYAEKRFAPDTAQRRNSIQDFKAALAVLGRDCPKRDERLELLCAQTDLVIAAHWSQVERVAAVLLEREVLRGDEIFDLIRPPNGLGPVCRAPDGKEIIERVLGWRVSVTKEVRSFWQRDGCAATRAARAGRLIAT
jgi:hypothetical protein